MPIDKKVGLAAGSSPLPRGLVHLQRLTLAFVAIVAVGAVFRLVRVNSLGGNFWITGDWLIRYADGYVRRGLLGELAWYLALPPGVDLLWAVTALQVMSFTAFAGFSFLLYLKTPPTSPQCYCSFPPRSSLFTSGIFKAAFGKKSSPLPFLPGSYGGPLILS